MHKLTCQKQPPSVSYQSNPKVSSLFPLFSSSCVLQLTYGLGGRKPQIMEPQGSTLLSHSVAAASSQPASAFNSHRGASLVVFIVFAGRTVYLSLLFAVERKNKVHNSVSPLLPRKREEKIMFLSS